MADVVGREGRELERNHGASVAVGLRITRRRTETSCLHLWREPEVVVERSVLLARDDHVLDRERCRLASQSSRRRGRRPTSRSPRTEPCRQVRRSAGTNVASTGDAVAVYACRSSDASFWMGCSALDVLRGVIHVQLQRWVAGQGSDSAGARATIEDSAGS